MCTVAVCSDVYIRAHYYYCEMLKLIISAYTYCSVRKSISHQTVLTVFSSSARCVLLNPYLRCILSLCSHSLSGPLRYRKFRFIKWYLLHGVGWQMLSVSALNRFRSIQLVPHAQNRNVCFGQICSVYNDKL